MKNIIILVLSLSLSMLNSIDKPLIKTGNSSYENFTLEKTEKSIYPSSIKDSVFISIDEKFHEYFTGKYKIQFDYTSNNKYSKDLENLYSFSMCNNLNLIFTLGVNRLEFSIKPSLMNLYGDNYFKDYNMISYKLNIKNFMFTANYSNQFSINKNELILHKINFSFYWNFPEKEFLKFKSSVIVNLQNPLSENNTICTLKGFNINFEMAIDFNNINFENLFKDEDTADNNE
jgi:hypothetical protein